MSQPMQEDHYGEPDQEEMKKRFDKVTSKVGPKFTKMAREDWEKDAMVCLLRREEFYDIKRDDVKFYKPTTSTANSSSEDDTVKSSEEVNASPKESADTEKQELKFKVVMSSSGYNYLLVERCGTDDDMSELIGDAFGNFEAAHSNFLMSNPDCAHCVLFEQKTGMPRLVDKVSDSPLAIIKEQDFDESRYESATEYYRERFKPFIVFSRLLELHERRYLMEKLGCLALKYEKLRLLDFYKVDEKNEAMETVPDDEKVDILYCRDMISPERIFKEYRLAIVYQNLPTSGIQVTLSDPADIIRAEDACRRAERSFYVVPDSSDRNIIVDQFPSRFKTFMGQSFELGAIFAEVGVRIVSTEPFRRNNVFLDDNVKEKINDDLEKLKAEQNLDGIEWNIKKGKDWGRRADYVVEFSELEDLEKIMRAIEIQEGPVFVVDGIVPQLQRRYVLSYAISKQARVALHDYFFKLAYQIEDESNDVMYLTTEREDGSETELIGIDGCCIEDIEKYLPKIQELLTPLKLSTENQPELLSRMGKRLMDYMRIKFDGNLVFDFDKYTGTISLLGTGAEWTFKKLKNLTEMKSDIFSSADWLYIPYHNPETIQYLSLDLLEKIKDSLNLKYLYLEKSVLHFKGTFHAHEYLVRWLDKLSDDVCQELLNMDMIEYREGTIEDCPICYGSIECDFDMKLFPCGHAICQQCLVRSIKDHFASFEPLKCAKEGCENISIFPPAFIERIVRGTDKRMKSLDVGKIKAIFMRATKNCLKVDKSRQVCDINDCPGIRYKSDHDDLVFRSKRCVVCDFEYCETCMQDAHSQKPCEDQKKLRQMMIEKLEEQDNIQAKECPKCDFLVYIHEGCNHVKCARCRTHFCFVCRYCSRDSLDMFYHMRDHHAPYSDVESDNENWAEQRDESERNNED